MAGLQWHAETTLRILKPLALAVIIFALIITCAPVQSSAAKNTSASSITIGPVAPGNVTELRSDMPENWESVNEEVRSIVLADSNIRGDIYGMDAAGDAEESISDDVTYVYGSSSSSWRYDVYSLQYPIISGSISKVTIYIRCKATDKGKNARTALQIGNKSFFGEKVHLNSSYENFSTDYESNPATGDAWTWTDIANACWGVALNDSSARCSRVWAVVEYTHVPGNLEIRANAISRIQYMLFDRDTLQVDATLMRNSSNKYAMVMGRGDGITIRGTGEINGNRAETKVISDPLIYIKGNGTTIEGISVAGNRQTGIMLAYPSNCTVRNITVKDCCSSHDSSALGVGILLYGPGDCNHITGCAIENSGLHGIQIFQTDTTEIANNYIDGVFGFFGISIYGHEDDTADGALISWNTIKNTRREGINIDNGEDLAIDHNYIENVIDDYGLCIYRSMWGIAEFNTIDSSFKDGIALEGSSNFIVRYNTIANCASGGYHHAAILVQSSGCSDSKNNLVEGNYIYDDSAMPNSGNSIKEVQVAGHIADENAFRNNIAFGKGVPNILLTGPNSFYVENETDEVRTSANDSL